MILSSRLRAILNFSPRRESEIDWVAFKIYDPTPAYRLEVRYCQECPTRLSGYNHTGGCFRHFAAESEEFLGAARKEDIIEKILKAGCECHKVSMDVIIGKDRSIQPLRSLMAYLMHNDAELSQSSIGNIMHRHQSVIFGWIKHIDLQKLGPLMQEIRSSYQNS